jgi:hypothetical protein
MLKRFAVPSLAAAPAVARSAPCSAIWARHHLPMITRRPVPRHCRAIRWLRWSAGPAAWCNWIMWWRPRRSSLITPISPHFLRAGLITPRVMQARCGNALHWVRKASWSKLQAMMAICCAISSPPASHALAWSQPRMLPPALWPPACRPKCGCGGFRRRPRAFGRTARRGHH